MSYQVAIEEMKDYLRVEVSGERVPGQEADDGGDNLPMSVVRPVTRSYW